jgi:hypothetical protein
MNCAVPFAVERAAVGLGAPNAGGASIGPTEPHNMGSFAIEYRARSHYGFIQQAPLTTCHALRDKYGPYGLLKLDIEGCEYDALRSDARWIRNHKPVLWAECNETAQSFRLLHFFLWAGLSTYFIAYPSFRRENYKGSTERIFPIAYEAGLLGVPADSRDSLDPDLTGEAIIVREVKERDDLARALWVTPRWGREEWLDLSRPELIGVLGREDTHQSFPTFLTNDEPPAPTS